MAKSRLNSRLKLINTEGLRAQGYKFPAPLRELSDIARKFLSQRLITVFEHVDDTFFDLADRAENNSEQTSYFDAMRMIRLERKAIEQQFSRSVENAFRQLGDPNYQGVVLDSDKLNIDNLKVLDNEDLEETIAFDSMVSKVSQRYKYEINNIIARINFIVPAEVVASSNPIGPEVLCYILSEAVDSLEVDIRARLVLLKLIDRHLIDGLGELLKTGNQVLREMGVLPDLDKKRRTGNAAKHAVRKPLNQSGAGLSVDNNNLAYSNNNSAAGYSDSVTGYNDSATDYSHSVADRGGQLVGQIQRLLQQTEANTPLAQRAQPVELDDLMSLVSNLQNDWVEQKTSDQTLLQLIQGRLQSQGNKGLHSRDQSVVHLLDQLFDRIRKEPGMSGGLSDELRKLEMPILRIALQDGTFFDKEKHPARQLLNQITEASVGYSDEMDFGADPIGKAIINVANVLNKSSAIDNDTLGKLLVNFMALVEKERRSSTAREQRIVEEAAAKEKVNQARQMVDATLAEHMQGKSLPQIIVTFAENAWCKVMFLSYLRHSKSPEDWNTSVALLDQLLAFSQTTDTVYADVKPVIASAQKALEDIAYDPYDLGRLIGGLEQFFDPSVPDDTLNLPIASRSTNDLSVSPPTKEVPAKETAISRNDGIIDINLLPAKKGASKSSDIANNMMNKLGAAPRTGAQSTNNALSAANGSLQNNSVTAKSVIAKPVSSIDNKPVGTVGQPTAQHDLMRRVTVEKLTSTIPGVVQQDSEQLQPVDDKYVQVANALGRGSWVDFMDKEAPNRRCKVAGVISPPGKYIFVNRQGVKVVEMSQNEIAVDIQENKLVIVESVKMFDRALEQVIKGIRSNRQIH